MALSSINILQDLDIADKISQVTGPVTTTLTTAAAPVADAINKAAAAGEIAASVGETITDLACGQEGIFTKIKQIQLFAQQKIMLGINVYNSVLDTISQVQTIIDQLSEPELLISLLQQEALNIVSQSILQDPTSANALATIANLRAAYQNAGPAAERIIDNLQQFIEDPLNTPLDVCNDIPNLVKIGETFVEFPAKALQADPSKTLENIQETIVKEYADIFNNPATRAEDALNEISEQVVRTASKYPLPDVLNDIIISGRVPVSQAYSLGPGSANKAALAQVDRTPLDIGSENKSSPSNIPSLANPFPEGQQYIAAEFSPSKNAKNIAAKINCLHPVCRNRFAESIKSFLNSNPEYDINLTEGYRAPYGSPNVSGGLTPTQIEAVNELNKVGITDPVAVANILAQIQAESGFRPRSENLAGYSAETLFRFYGAGNKNGNKVRFNTIEEARALKAQGPEAVGNLLYGGRLGNAPNEGFKYRGRGLIQLTGKDNYKAYSKKIGVDLVADPDLANDPSIASRIAVQYFLTKQKSGTNLKDIASVGKAVGYAGGKTETNKRAKIAETFLAKLDKGGYDNLPPGDSWHNFGVAADVVVYANGKPIDPDSNSSVYTNELKTAFSSNGLINDKGAEPTHFYLASLGSKVPDDLKEGKIAFNDYIGNQTGTTAKVSIARTETVTRYDVTKIQREARSKAIADALANGASATEAEAAGEAAGNRAGRLALEKIVV